ncbi:ComEC/Rec2 family competence protein [Actinokineospora sp. PR83]|uniref:ComEC/Rec2 family competence protein n=1 Tax=Actinokineospora sp. PR83 TaxID=2884908 RepID=UPI0027E1F5FA|nr:ComEC/Rec2 family competence protein [Actinokineospora sp. PR83]MCG8917046.1 ComEC/Rec2 family competence protein [Actinokineospora sp. PR83]
MIGACRLTDAPVRHDWRLVPGALAVWAAALLALLVHWSSALVIGAVTVVVACLLLRTGRRAWPLLVSGLVAAWPVLAAVHDAATHPLREAAARQVSRELDLVVAERPRPVRSAGFGATPTGPRSVVVPADTPDGARVALLAPVQAWADVLPGQPVRARGTLAPADPGTLTVALLRVRGPPLWAGEAPGWQRLARDLRVGLRDAAGVLDPDSAGLLPALVVGDTDGLPDVVEDEFRVAGMSHLLAVSGSNLAIICVAVLFLLRLLWFGPRGSAAGALAALVGFVVLVGPEPSVLRAGVMGAVGLLALALGRERSAIPALAGTVLLLVAVDPGLAVAPGFVLSVLATGALVLLAPRWVDRMTRRRVPRVVAEALAVPAAAHLATAPVVAGLNGQVSVVAVVANLVAAPVVAPATVFGVLAAVLAPLWTWAAVWCVRLAGPEVDWLVAVARWAADVPGAAIDWPSGWWGGLVAVVVLLVLVVALRGRGTVVAVGLVAVLLVVVPVRVLAPGWPPAGWAVVACDVGQGDALVLATDEPGRAVVVDAGPEASPVDGCLDRLGVDRVPLVVLSHLHADHVGGLAGVLAGRAVGGIAVGAGRSPAWAWDQVRHEAADAGVPVVGLLPGQRLGWPGLTLDVLAPQRKEAGRAPDGTEINNRSVVLRASTRAGRVLLAGDVELGAQAELLTSGVDLRAEVVKVPHHGSGYTAPEFLTAVGARIALLSVGADNRYGHPSPRTLDVLTRGHTLVGRTDRDGDSAVVVDAGVPALIGRGGARSPPKP